VDYLQRVTWVWHSCFVAAFAALHALASVFAAGGPLGTPGKAQVHEVAPAWQWIEASAQMDLLPAARALSFGLRFGLRWWCGGGAE
jgi:hypothetical protein